MKVYILEKHYDYEGFIIHGVYETKQQAEIECWRLKIEEYPMDDALEISEHSVIHKHPNHP